MEFKKIYLPRISIIICLALVIAGIIYCITTEQANGIGLLAMLLLLSFALIIYLILLAFSFSAIGKNSPYGLFFICLIPALVFLYYY
ncbi:hypothetical protein [Ferruginibacter sp. SUN106]|uniref:hypothetical protein n=1 Tax=Ferruginibacter sp. SUN106 TaxID=2978348 RepID=UPI003D360E46